MRRTHRFHAVLGAAAGLGAAAVVVRMTAGTTIAAVIALVVCLMAAVRYVVDPQRISVLALLRVALYLFVAMWAILVVVTPEFQRPLVDGVVTATVGLLGAIAALFPGRGTVGARYLRVADVLAFNLSIVLVATELALRCVAWVVPSPIFALADATPREVLRLNRFPPRMMYNGRPCDERGYNDDPPSAREPGHSLVVAVGDSFSVGIVPHRYLYATIAERLLGDAHIYSMGVNGCGPREYLLMLDDEVLAMHPDAVIVALYLGNDVTDASRATGVDDGLRRWFCRENLLIWQVPTRTVRLAREPGVRRIDDRNILTPEEFASYRDMAVEDLLAGMPWLDDVGAEIPTHSAEAFLRMETWRADQICGRGTVHYPRFLGALDHLREVLESAGVPLLMVLIPEEFQVEDALWHEIEAALAEVPLERDRPQQRVSSWCREHGLPCLDLLPVLRAEPPLEDGDRHLYHRRDTHFNARGNQVAGEALARFVSSTRQQGIWSPG